MKRFNVPFVSRKKHLAAIRDMEREIRELIQKLERAENKLKMFRAAQGGECVPSVRCKNCSHCLLVTEHYGLGTYTNSVCELTIPQCQNFQQKN